MSESDNKTQKKTLFEAAQERRQKQGKTGPWQHRAVFLALKEEIETALSRGMTMKEIWAAAVDSGRTDMGYESFRRYCKEEGLKPTQAKQKKEKPPPTKPATKDPERPRSFKHSPTPDLKKLYGDVE